MVQTQPTETQAKAVSPYLAAFAAWIVPGLGYWLIGQRARALIAGIAIILVFILGILIGGIRVMDPPGWGENGFMTQIVTHTDGTEISMTRVDPKTKDQAADPTTNSGDHILGPAIIVQPVAELGERPWFAPQILCGPLTMLAADFSIHEARPVGDSDEPHVVESHSRSWEIGTLYTAVAGMLNLLIIIDAGFRAAAGGKKK